MEFSSSWRFSLDSSQLLHLALYVRDAAMLDVRPSPDIPPPLTWESPRREKSFSVSQRATAAGQWVEWWHRLLAFELNEVGQSEIERDDDAAYRTEAMAARYEEAFDPPNFESLASMRTLQSEVRTMFNQGLEFYNMTSERRSSSFPWEIVRSAAESTAHTRKVPVNHMRAVVHLLDVEGMWSYILAPGCALCSSAVAANRDAAFLFLQETFRSVHV